MPEKKKTVVPRLRFPEFRDAGPWEVKRLGEIAEVVRGGSPRPISQFLTTDDDGLNWLKIGDITNESKYVLSTEEKIKKTGLSKTREVHPGDLILSNSMSFGRPYIMGIRACIHDGWLALTDLKSGRLSEYLYYFILSDFPQRYLHDAAAGGGVRNLNADIVKLLPIATPLRVEEQQKIADCLASLDELIRAEDDQLAALKDHKKGLMQQLFPREGETTPCLRFPEFHDAGPWEVKRLGEVCEINNGSSNAQDHVDAGEYPLFDRSLTVKRSNTYLFDCEAVIIPGEGSEFSPRYYKGKFDLHQRAYALTQFNVEGKFVFFLMDRWKARLAEQAVKSTVLSLRMPILENFRITIPSKPEQRKIADCLSSLDDLIRAKATRIEALKTHKRGLMQQLFPQEVD